MTWIAGKLAPADDLGMGHLVWLNGSRRDLDSIQTLEDASVGGTGRGGVSVPAVLGIASSQVEGTPVVDKGGMDAKGKLIKVYLPGEFPGEKLGLLH